jgi:hypothetical protein
LEDEKEALEDFLISKERRKALQVAVLKNLLCQSAENCQKSF